jgi:rRNA maturation endonuclease Nob1
MGSVPIEKIETMLKVYRERLARAETPPIDYAVCIGLSAQIGLLEDLYYMAHHDAAQHGVQRTCTHCGLNFTDGANSIERQGYCPHCGQPLSANR